MNQIRGKTPFHYFRRILSYVSSVFHSLQNTFSANRSLRRAVMVARALLVLRQKTPRRSFSFPPVLQRCAVICYGM